jgi:hypothetical protein
LNQPKKLGLLDWIGLNSSPPAPVSLRLESTKVSWAECAMPPLLTAALPFQAVTSENVGNVSRRQATLRAHQMRVSGSLRLLCSSGLRGLLSKQRMAFRGTACREDERKWSSGHCTCYKGHTRICFNTTATPWYPTSQPACSSHVVVAIGICACKVHGQMMLESSVTASRAT